MLGLRKIRSDDIRYSTSKQAKRFVGIFVSLAIVQLLFILVFSVHSPLFSGSATDTELTQSFVSIDGVLLPLVVDGVAEDDPILTPNQHGSSWGTPIALSPLGDLLWTVNPDSGSVSAIRLDSLSVDAEIGVGGEPWSVVVSPLGDTVYVGDRASGSLIQIDVETYQVTRSSSIGAEIGTIALSPSGNVAYVSLMASQQLVEVDLRTLRVLRRVQMAYMPYAVGVTNDGDDDDDDEQVIVTHLFASPVSDGQEATDDGRQGLVSMLDAASFTLVAQRTLPADQTGFPNLLAAVSIIGDRVWIPTVRAAPDHPNTLSTTVFAAVSTFELSDTAGTSSYLPLNDMEIFGSPVNNPVAAIPSRDGERLYIVLAGSDMIEVVDVSDIEAPQLDGFVATGANPRGMALSLDGQRGYVMNYLSRSVSVLDLETLTVEAEIRVTEETLDADILHGKILFNNAVNPKLSQGSWISCASCHPDGGTDSVTWMFPDGPRQTPPIWNAGATLPWHWSAALDEPHDVEETIHIVQHGLGLAPGPDPANLGEPNAGRSADLDALAAFMIDGIRAPTVVNTATVSLTESVHAGRELFRTRGCNACHGGTNWTSSAVSVPAGTLDSDGNGVVDKVLHDVGTLNPRDVRGHLGFDPPALTQLSMTAPYLHDGSMATLEELLWSNHPAPTEEMNPLDEVAIEELVSFLNTIDLTTTPID